MNVAIAADHAGFDLKQHLIVYMLEKGYDVLDLGVASPDQRSDYPDVARTLGEAITAGRAVRGILVCGSGVGASIAANKIRGVYAAICHDAYSAAQGVEHDNMNVLCLGGRIVGTALAQTLVSAFLSASFQDETERYLRRFEKVQAMEQA